MSEAGPAPEVEAAGGVVVRTHRGVPQVVAVHRPRHADWSLPKGKLAAGESHRQAALREVEEETGLTCRAFEELPQVEYQDPRGRSKRVRYWRMEPVAGDVRSRPPDREVDAVAWLDAVAAAERLSYPRDRELAALGLSTLGRERPSAAGG